MVDPSTHLFWITSRAAGITAMVLASASVGVGLSIGGRLFGKRMPDRRPLHEVLALSTLVAIAVHGLSLLGDAYLRPSVFDISVPFVSSYETPYTSTGIICGWALAFLGLSYYARKRIGVKRWQLIHRFTLLAWVGSLVHTFTEGTDAGQAWFIAVIGIAAAPVIVLFTMRILGSRRSSVSAPKRATSARSSASAPRPCPPRSAVRGRRGTPARSGS
jgi:methionine sulfoxide reductase heme-binding subunit